MINYYPRPSDCVKGSPFEKMLWYAWYVLIEDRPMSLRAESKKYLELIIEAAIQFDIDQISVEKIRLTTFRLLKWKLEKK